MTEGLETREKTQSRDFPRVSDAAQSALGFDPYDWPVAWMSAIEQQHMRNSTTLLAKLGLHHRDFRILVWLGKDPGVGVGYLAECVGLERPTVSKMIDRLVAQHLLERRRHPRDRRRTELFLTAEGRRKLDKAIPLVRGLLQDYMRGLTRDEQKTLTRLMKKFGGSVKTASRAY